MSMDISGFDEIADDMRVSSAAVMKQVRGVVSKGALNIKNQMRDEALGSDSFKRLAQTIRYDIESGSDFVEAEIGPDTDVQTHRRKTERYNENSSPGSAASLRGVAYFGGSRGGGGTLPDPLNALKAEESSFISALENLDGLYLE